MDHVRAIVLDVTPERPLARACVVHARATDTVNTNHVDLTAAVDDRGTLARLAGAEIAAEAFLSDLNGATVGRGFRARLAPLAQLGPHERLLRRVLWELPIVVQVASQTALLDHPGAGHFVMLDERGIDQCSGWRARGEMFTQAVGDDGLLRMPLGPERPGPTLTAPWLPDLREIPPMSTRRSRVLSVQDDVVRLHHQDAYADPDGVSRALHEWSVTARLDGRAEDRRIGAISVEAGRLPWQECPFAGASAERLVGRALGEIEQAVAEEFLGIGTCTHLNDLLRMLADVSDVASIR